MSNIYSEKNDNNSDNQLIKCFNVIVNYFGFQSFSINNGKGGMNDEFLISGKVRKSNINLFLMFAIFFLVSNICFALDSINKIIALVIIFLITTLVLFINHKILFSKLEEKVDNINLYQRWLPSNLKPAHVRMLLKDGLIDQISVASTLLDLIDNDYLEIVDVDRKTAFFNKTTNLVIRRTNKKTDNLLEFEKYIIDWFFNICANNKSISSNELKNCLKNHDDSNAKFTEFKALVTLSFPIDHFYKDTRKRRNKQLILNLILIFVGFFSYLISPFLVFIPVYGFGSLIFNSPCYVLNENGKREINYWKSLKNFLEDFSSIEDKSVEMIELWDFYLTYSIVLNVNKSAKNEILDFFGPDINKGSSINYQENISTENINEYIKQYKSIQMNTKNIIKASIDKEKQKYNFHSNIQ